MYMQWGTQVKCEMTGRVTTMQMLNLYSGGISKMLKIDYKEEFCQEIDENLIIKDNMVYTGPLMVYTLVCGCH